MSAGTAVVLLIAGILAVLILIALNAWFVAQEFAFMSVDRSRLAARAEAGDRAASRALAVTKRTSFMLSGAQLGITVTGLLVGELAEPLIGGAVSELTGSPATTVAIIVLLFATLLQMVAAELYPKNLALAAPEATAQALARSTGVYLRLFGWLIAFFDWSSNMLLKLVGVTPVEDVDSTADSRDLARIVADARTSGELTADVSGLIERILDFPGRTVYHAMVPRSRTGELSADATVGSARQRMAVEHTRYPVLTGSGADERILGVLHLGDLLDPDLEPDTPVTELLRDAVVVPEVMRLPDVLSRLGARDERLACVIDEHGVFSGIVTVEDLAEEMFGALADEHDQASATLAPDVDGPINISGAEHLDEVGRILGIPMPETQAETLAGLVIDVVGDLPIVGDIIEVALPEDPRAVLEEPSPRRLAVEVRSVQRHVPTELTVSVIADGPQRRGEEIR